MRKEPVIVLKFGGSVLLDERRLRIAVHEIYRWRRDGWRVVAVVSALAGRTDELIAQCASINPSVNDGDKAAVIAQGELESAAMLGVQLDRAGIPAQVLTPADVRFIADGDPLDANPVSIDVARIESALEHDGIVVFPGFVAIDQSSRIVTLGRGGSDLSAVFLCNALGADRCRLIKDVDGLNDRDPALIHLDPLRYGEASYEDALSTDGTIIQHKAVRYAQGAGIEFELGRFNGVRPTRIGSLKTRFDDQSDLPNNLRVVVCGLGTVGQGVVELISQLPALFTIVGSACASPSKHEDLIPLLGTISDDAIGVSQVEADVVIELIGGVEVAQQVVANAIELGRHVITANKPLIARDGDVLRERAQRNEGSIRYSASVGGSLPVLEVASRTRPRAIQGIFNGTGNFILGSLERGKALESAVVQAQELGFAERDPSRDLDGRDVVDKLRVIADLLGWRDAGANIQAESIAKWVENGDCVYPSRHIATLDSSGGRVVVESVDADSLFAQTHNEWNVFVASYEDSSQLVVRGKGAGRWPTSEAVMADLLELSRACATQASESGVCCVSK